MTGTSDSTPTVSTLRADAADAQRASRSAFDHAVVGMAITDRDGVLIESNSALEELLGRPTSQLSGSSLFAFTHPEDLPVAHAACRSLEDPTRMSSSIDVRLLRPGDEPVAVRVSTAKVLAGDGSTSHLVMHLQDVSDHAMAAAELRELAFRDPLTGLANRALLQDRLAHAVDRHRRHGGPVSVLFLDLDEFKAVNDTHGHGFGDQVLCSVATVLVGIVRRGTTVARIGGDEFVLLCEDTTADEAEGIADRIKQALADAPLPGPGGVLQHVSIGVATLTQADGGPGADVAARILDAADIAMYQRKRRRGTTAMRMR